MTPEQVVNKLAEIIVSRSAFTQDEICAELAAHESNAIANRAYKFTQIAWGRALLRSLGVQESMSDYLCLDANGEIVDSGHLGEEPYFVAASRLVDRHSGSNGFQVLATMSADFVAVNKQLRAGAAPRDLAVGSAFVFLDHPTPTGIEKFQRLLASHAAAISTGMHRASPEGAEPSPWSAAGSPREPETANKRWWQFWR